MWHSRIEFEYYSIAASLSLMRCSTKLPLGAGLICASWTHQIFKCLHSILVWLSFCRTRGESPGGVGQAHVHSDI